LKESGYHGYIVPDAVLVRDESQVLRTLLLESAQFKKIAHVGAVFPHPGVSAVVIVLLKGKEAIPENIVHVERLEEARQTELINQIPQSRFLRHEKRALMVGLSDQWEVIKQKLTVDSQVLAGFVTLSRGEEFGKRNLQRQEGEIPSGMVPILVGEDVKRYSVSAPEHLICMENVTKPISNYQSPKIVIVKTGSRFVCALDTESRYTLQSLYNVRLKTSCPYDLNYILAILNSTLMSDYLEREVTSYKKLFPQINQSHILALPIKAIDFDNPTEKKMYDDLVALVDKMLELNKRLAPLRNTPSDERNELLQEIERTDAQIDQKVYELYGLTEEERQIIETSVVSKS
ncbi:hypothetical protein M1M86_01010, partial [Dehalococcoidales bacterium]|nr:hypothetical protein [Dehalococcoidales bacterium]